MIDGEISKRENTRIKSCFSKKSIGRLSGHNNVTRKEKTGAFKVCGDYPEFILQQTYGYSCGAFYKLFRYQR